MKRTSSSECVCSLSNFASIASSPGVSGFTSITSAVTYPPRCFIASISSAYAVEHRIGRRSRQARDQDSSARSRCPARASAIPNLRIHREFSDLLRGSEEQPSVHLLSSARISNPDLAVHPGARALRTCGFHSCPPNSRRPSTSNRNSRASRWRRASATDFPQV